MAKRDETKGRRDERREREEGRTDDAPTGELVGEMFALELSDFFGRLLVVEMHGAMVLLVEAEQIVVLQHFEGRIILIELFEIVASFHARFDLGGGVRQRVIVDRAAHAVQKVQSIAFLVAKNVMNGNVLMDAVQRRHRFAIVREEVHRSTHRVLFLSRVDDQKASRSDDRFDAFVRPVGKQRKRFERFDRLRWNTRHGHSAVFVDHEQFRAGKRRHAQEVRHGTLIDAPRLDETRRRTRLVVLLNGAAGSSCVPILLIRCRWLSSVVARRC